MSELLFVKSQAFSLGEVPYSISVYHSAEGYLAFCDCHMCADHNMRTQPHPDQDAAVKECEELIRAHHDGCHGQSCRVAGA
jgi:hypothetical protein